MRPRRAILKTPIFKVSQAHPFGLVNFQALPDEVLEIIRDGDVGFELDRYLGHFVDQLGLSFALPRGLAVKQLVDHDPDRPDIILDRVDVLLQGLRRHVERAADVVLFFLRGRAI